MNGADIIVKSLEDLKVNQVFGYPGAAILPVFHSLGASNINVAVSANEQSCAFGAAGISRAGDGVGVAVVTSGPAITNTLTAVADSNADSIPLLVFAGQVTSGKMGTDEFQHINVTRVFEKAAKKVILVRDPDNIEETVKDAYFYAKTGKPGPVVIDLPMDIQINPGTYKGIDPEVYKSKYDAESHLSIAQCKKFFGLLSNAKRPLLYIGGGLNNPHASQQIREFNRIFDIPSINSLMGKGILDEASDTHLGMLGMFGTPYANRAIQETDLFVAMGVRWDDRVAQKVGESGLEADIAYIDVNPQKVQEVRVSRRPSFSFIGDAGTALQDLLGYCQHAQPVVKIHSWQERTRQLKQSMPLNYNRETDTIQQAGIMEVLSGLLPGDIRVSTGVGNHQMLASQYLKIKHPQSFITSGGFGTMGFALPVGIGAHYEDPKKTMLVIDGDGGLKMNMGELHTVGARNLPIKILLLNNYSLGMVRNIQTARYEGRIVVTEEPSREINFSKIAQECGFQFTRTVTEKSEITEALTAFLSSEGSALLEVITDTQEVIYPIVPAGMGYADMETGPYIKTENG